MFFGYDRSDDLAGLLQHIWVGEEGGSGKLEVLGQRARSVCHGRTFSTNICQHNIYRTDGDELVLQNGSQRVEDRFHISHTFSVSK